MPYLKKKEILLLLERVGQNNINRRLTVPTLKQQLNQILDQLEYPKRGRNNLTQLTHFTNAVHQRQVAEVEHQQHQQQQRQMEQNNQINYFHQNQYEQDLLEYRREQQQEYAQHEYDQQIQQRLLNETIQFTRPENFSETRRNFVLPQIYIEILQNEEIKDKINKYNNGEVNEIENDWSNTLLYFPPQIADKFIEAVSQARKGYHFEKDIEGEISNTYYNNFIYSLGEINNFIDDVYEKQNHKPFKITFDFGVIYEDQNRGKSINGQSSTVSVSYGHITPNESRTQKHIPKSIINEQDIEEYKQFVKSEIIEMQNFNLDSTKQRFIAIYSMMIKTFKLSRYHIGGSIKELIDFHMKGHRNCLRTTRCKYNICWFYAYNLFKYPDTQEKRIKEHSREHMAKEHMAKFYELPYKTDDNEFQKWLNDFTGFDIETEIDEFVLKEKINVNIYSYSVENQTYYQSKVYKYSEDVNEAADESNDETINEPVEIPEFNVLIDEAQNGETSMVQHAFYISNKETLTGLKFCPFCKQKAFDPKDIHFVAQYEKHIKKCEINGGKIVKEIKLEAVQRPFCPHIMQNKTYQFLLANNRENEFKPTQYYITYDFETVEKVINKDFGKSSKQLSQLVPLSVASTIKNKQGIKTIYFDLRNGTDFIDQWLKQIFIEAEQIQQDNQYSDKIINDLANNEVPIVGFNSAKFDFALIFKNLQSLDWEIKSYIGSSSQAKSIIVKHKHSQIKLKFCDIMVYVQAMTLKDFAKNFSTQAGDEKGVFPYEYINTDNFNEVLNQSEPFPQEAFNSTLKNSSMCDGEYKLYLEDAKQFKNRWEYLQYYNEQDTKIMIAPIDNLIQMNISYKIDMFSFMSMAACANAIKYALAYKDFDINANYPPVEDKANKFILYPSYWKYKVEGYRFQDQIKHRDSSKNVSVNDFDYFKQLLETSACAICGDKFTFNNRPTLDRLNNDLPHTKENVQPCCLYCNKYCSNKDKNISRLFIQLRRFCMLNCLPTNLTNIEDYKLIRSGITGGLSNVMHRENIAGKDVIKQFVYGPVDKKVHVHTTNDVISHVVGVDFNSLYPSVMSSEPHKFIKYTGGKMYMAGSIQGRTDDKDKIMDIIRGRDQLFIADIKGHIDEKYINDFINFPLFQEIIPLPLMRIPLAPTCIII